MEEQFEIEEQDNPVYMELRAENDRLTAQLQRAQADCINIRRRAERERKDFVAMACADLMKAIVPVLDDFERGLSLETPDTEHARGMALIHKRLSALLQASGLEAIPALGERFDPAWHQAIERRLTEQTNLDQQVVAEHQRGYLYNGFLIRPAMVAVAIHHEAAPAAAEEA